METMQEGADEIFTSPTDLINSMPYELSWSAPPAPDRLWVFWRQKDDELRSLLGSLDPSIDTFSPVDRTISEKIKDALHSFRCFSSSQRLVQFWAPVQTGERTYITTANQSFGLTKLHKGLCSYRRVCLSTPIHVNEQGYEEEHSLIARVFRRGRLECCYDVSQYLSEEYHLRDYAIELGVRSYMALPVFQKSGKQILGVLEILSTFELFTHSTLEFHIAGPLRKIGLRAYDEPFYMTYPTERRIASQIVEELCRSHPLPLVRIWAASSTKRCVSLTFNYSKSPNFYTDLLKDGNISTCYMWEGEGVVGRAFASRGACFCNNVSKSLSVNPLAPIARKFGLAGCFAICLESTWDDGIFFILEFFLPLSGIDYTDPTNFLGRLVASLKEKVQSSGFARFEKLWEKIFVEVIKTSDDDEHDSFEICGTTQILSTKRKRIGFGSYTMVESGPPFFNSEVGLDLELNLAPSITGVQSYSEVQSNSLSSMNLSMHLSPPNGLRNYTLVQPNSPSLVKEMRMGVHLDLDPRLEAEDDSTSSSSVKNYSVVPNRSATPSTSLSISSNDSDFTDVNAVCQILRYAKRRMLNK